MTLTAKPTAAPLAGDESEPAAASARRSACADATSAPGCAAAGCRRSSSSLPMLFVFTIFSWSPIVQSVIMSLQKTNLLDPPTWVGLDNFVHVLNDPLLGTAILNTLYFAVLALIFGFPLPILMAVLMSEVRRGKGFYSALAYLPVVVPPVVAVLLWKVFYDASPTGSVQHDPRLGRHPAAAVAAVVGHGDALARARGDVGGGGRRRSSSTSRRC